MKNKDGALRWGLAIFLTVSAILLFYDTLFGRRVLPAFGSQLLGALQPVIIGGVLAYLLAPVIDFIERRLFPGGPECRLKGAYVIKCVGYETDEAGNVTEIAAEYDPDSRGGDPADGRKIKGATIHWVDAATAIDAEVRLYDNLFTLENVNDVPEGTDYLDYLNPDSLKKLTGCKLEPSLADAKEGDRFQFVRMGYYCKDHETGRFNRKSEAKRS